MENNYLITHKENYIEAISGGTMTLECIIKLWSNIIHACKQSKCFKILSISDSETPISETEALNHLKSFEHLKISRDYRVAMVNINPVRGESTLLVDSLLSSHGMDVKSFMNIEDARSWLFFGRKI
jgi:hypothetical protein